MKNSNLTSIILMLFSALFFFSCTTEDDDTKPAAENELIAHFDFEGNSDDLTNKNIITIKNSNQLIVTDTYLHLKNSRDGDTQRSFNLAITSAAYDKIELVSKNYYIHKGNYTMSGFTYRVNNWFLQLTHNNYHFSGTNETGQYDLRENIYLNFWEKDPRTEKGTGVYKNSDLLPLVQNEWITETITLDFKNNSAHYTLETDTKTYDIELSSIDLNLSTDAEFGFGAWDWANGSELRIDDLKVYGYKE